MISIWIVSVLVIFAGIFLLLVGTVAGLIIWAGWRDERRRRLSEVDYKQAGRTPGAEEQN